MTNTWGGREQVLEMRLVEGPASEELRCQARLPIHPIPLPRRCQPEESYLEPLPVCYPSKSLAAGRVLKVSFKINLHNALGGFLVY